MTMKVTPIITYTEILARAIRSIEAEVAEWHSKGANLPQEFRDTMIATGTKELMVKLDALKTLYRIETGKDID